jgi:hypothetical protein
MNCVRLLLAFCVFCASILHNHQTARAQPHQTGPSIRELFEASQSFSGGTPQVIDLEKQQVSLSMAPSTPINFIGGDCLTLLAGKLSLCTSAHTLELKANEIYFDVLNDSLAIFELDQNGSLRVSMLRGPGAVLSFQPDQSTGSGNSKKIMQIKEGQSYKFNNKRSNSDSAKEDQSILYADSSHEIIEAPVPADWMIDPLFMQLRSCNVSSKRINLLLNKHKNKNAR